MSNVGYVRVLRRVQHPGIQLAALRETGCDTIFKEKVSGISSMLATGKMSVLSA